MYDKIGILEMSDDEKMIDEGEEAEIKSKSQC